MNIYDIIDTLATAIRDSNAVKTFCVSKWSKGCLIQIDENQEKPELDSSKTPWVLLSAMGGSVAGVAEADTYQLSIAVGASGIRAASPVTSPWSPVVTTARTATANGLQKIGCGNDIADFLDSILLVVGATAEADGVIVTGAQYDVSGFQFYPMQVAFAVVSFSRKRSLKTESFA
jgi:hypothetical protein